MAVNWKMLEEEIENMDGWSIIHRYETKGYESLTSRQIGLNDVQAAYAVIKAPSITEGVENFQVWGYVEWRDVWVNAVKPGPLVSELLRRLSELTSALTQSPLVQKIKNGSGKFSSADIALGFTYFHQIINSMNPPLFDSSTTEHEPDKSASTETTERLYYIQDTRDYIGNALVWWRKGGGYTDRLDEAQVFTEVEAQELTSERYPHKPWLKPYIDAHTFTAVNAQDVTRDNRGIKQGNKGVDHA